MQGIRDLSEALREGKRSRNAEMRQTTIIRCITLGEVVGNDGGGRNVGEG